MDEGPKALIPLGDPPVTPRTLAVLAAVLSFIISGTTCTANLTLPVRLPLLRGLVFLGTWVAGSFALGVALHAGVSLVLPSAPPGRRLASAVLLYVGAGALFVASVRLLLPHFLGGQVSLWDGLLMATWPVWLSWFGYGALGGYCLPFN